MKPRTVLSRTLCLLFCLCLLLPSLVGGVVRADNIVTQTSMVRVLQSLLETTCPPTSEYATGEADPSLSFLKTALSKLYGIELESRNMDTCTSLTKLASFNAGDTVCTSLEATLGALRFGDVMQYGNEGHPALILGMLPGTNSLVLYDCGFGGGNTVRLRFCTEEEMRAQIALSEQDHGGALFYHYTALPPMSITLSLMNKPSALSYYLGTDISMSGISLEYYSAQSGKQVVLPETVGFRYFCTSKEAGKVPAVLLYGSALTFLSLEIKDETVSSVQVSPLPTKTEYYEDATLDMTGAVVTATLKDGTQSVLAEGEYTLSYDFSKAGTAAVHVSFGGKTTDFTVTVVEPPVLKLTVVAPTKTEYYAGERIDISGGSILVDYETKQNVALPLTESMLALYDTSKPGELTITVNYGGKTTSFAVMILANDLVSLHLVTELNKEYRIGSTLNGAGIQLLATYQNGATRTINASECIITINGEKTNALRRAGVADIVFTYEGISTGTTAVNVTEDPFAKSLRLFIFLILLIVGIPLLVIFSLRLIKKLRAKKAAEGGAEQEAVLPVEDEQDADMRFYDPDRPAPPRSAEDPTIRIPSFKRSDSRQSATDDPTISFTPPVAGARPFVDPETDTPETETDTPRADDSQPFEFFDEL